MAATRATAALAAVWSSLLAPHVGALRPISEEDAAPAAGQRPKPNLLLATHHKTGTAMVSQIAKKCLADVANVTQNIHWDPSRPISDGFKVIHVIRHPSEVVISGYLYHRNGVGELWEMARGSALDILGKDEDVGPVVVGNESYREFLRRVPLYTGLHAEVSRVLGSGRSKEQHGGQLKQMRGATSACLSDARRCRQFCLEEFVADYIDAWRRALTFAEIEMDQSLISCIEKFALDRSKAHDGHKTSDLLTEEEHARLSRLVERIDAIHYGSLIQKTSPDLTSCGKARDHGHPSSDGFARAADKWA